MFFVKRFLIETLTKKYPFIAENDGLAVVSTDYKPKVNVPFNKRLKETKDLNDKVFELNDIIDVKGEKAQGNQLTRLKIKDITLLDVVEGEEWPEESVDEVISASNESIENNEVPLDVADDKNDKKSNENNVAEESKEGPVEMEWDVNDDNNQELDDNGQIKIF